MPVRARSLSTTMLTSVIGASFVLPMTASAAELNIPVGALSNPLPAPAVDGWNWKAGGLGGSLANRTIAAGIGSLSVPLASQYGFQLDGVLGSYDGNFVGATGAHLFWRDPNRGLLGVYGDYTHWSKFSGVGAGRVAGEGEAYFGPWTLQGIAGIEFGNSTSAIVGSQLQTIDIKTRFFDKINVAYYFHDNLKGFVGHRYIGGKNALALGGEWGFNVNGPMMGALFVEGRIGENDFRGVWGGLRFYQGQREKTLIQRHRQDDPIEWTPETLFTITNSFISTPLPSPPPPPPPICMGDFC